MDFRLKLRLTLGLKLMLKLILTWGKLAVRLRIFKKYQGEGVYV